jgi:hypothetical protein
VVNSFYNAPVPNPDGSTGINLHCLLDEDVPPEAWEDDLDNDGIFPYGEDLNGDGLLNDGIAAPLLNEATAGFDFNRNGNMTEIINEDANGDGVLGAGDEDDQIGKEHYKELRESNFGTIAERADPNATQILAAKALVYRYAVFADHFVWPRDDGVGVHFDVSGVAYDGGSFVVSLGVGWGAFQIEEEAGTFMHELGHTLGLAHGGDVPTNHKPNYFSTMSYTWQTPKLAYQESWMLDYSSGTAVSPIVENSIDETAGLGGVPGLQRGFPRSLIR